MSFCAACLTQHRIGTLKLYVLCFLRTCLGLIIGNGASYRSAAAVHILSLVVAIVQTTECQNISTPERPFVGFSFAFGVSAFTALTSRFGSPHSSGREHVFALRRPSMCVRACVRLCDVWFDGGGGGDLVLCLVQEETGLVVYVCIWCDWVLCAV